MIKIKERNLVLVCFFLLGFLSLFHAGINISILNLQPPQVSLFLSLAISTVIFLSNKNYRMVIFVQTKFIFLSLSIWFLALLISVIFANDTGLSLRYFSNFAAGFYGFLMWYFIFSKNQHILKTAFTAIAFGVGFSVAFLIFLDVSSILGSMRIHTGRLSGFAQNPNLLALFLVSYLPILCSLIIASSNKKIKLSCYFFLLLTLLLIIFSGSKWNTIVAFAFMVYFFQQKYKGKMNALSRYLLVIAAGALLFYTGLLMLELYMPRTLEHFQGLLASPDESAAYTARYEIWIAAMPYFYDNFWFGIGVRGVNSIFVYSHLHNVLVELLVTTGVVGFGAFLYFNLVYLASVIKAMRKYNASILFDGMLSQYPHPIVLFSPVLIFFSALSSDSFGTLSMIFFWSVMSICVPIVGHFLKQD